MGLTGTVVRMSSCMGRVSTPSEGHTTTPIKQRGTANECGTTDGHDNGLAAVRTQIVNEKMAEFK